MSFDIRDVSIEPGVQAGNAKVNVAWRSARPEDIALSFNVEPEGSIKLKYLNLGRCNSKKINWPNERQPNKICKNLD